MTALNLSKNVKFSNPEYGEDTLEFVIVNYNEITERCLIECINSGLSLAPVELVSVNDIVNI